MYTVKSGYHILHEMKGDNQMSEKSDFCHKLWNLKVPHFLWQGLTGCLPTKNMLKIRKVNVTEFCLMCTNAVEIVIHVLTTCTFAKACWSRLAGRVVPNECSTFSEWLELVFDNC